MNIFLDKKMLHEKLIGIKRKGAVEWVCIRPWLGLGVEVHWNQENKLVKEGRWNAHNIT